ncbi:MAG: ABC transporter ATP-binding protein [Spirochaetaceae bacterium]|nr:ABC transporter ATP-binding protein [Spirochaetaceae bacterium]
MKRPVVQFADFGFQYKAQKNPTLTGINLVIYEGEKVLILGSSGSGKTTLANCINGLVPFSYPGQMTGSCKVNGRETRELSVFELSRDVGTVLQDSNAQFVGLSVGEDMAFAMENNGVDRETMRERVREQAETVGLAQYLDALPFHLSGGQKQKAALGGVLGEETQVFIFDEPLASLDPKTGSAAIDLIDRITRNDGGPPRTTIIIEHRLEDALFRPVDRIVLVDKGRIAADMRPADILKSGILPEKGIRLPLYIGALKYAGCDLSMIQAIEDSATLELGAENRKRLNDFFCGIAREEESRPAPHDELLRVAGVSFSYETAGGGSRSAIENASFTVRRGERVAFIGKNGAGKSTMAKLITGICRPEKGAVYLGGEDYRKLTVNEIGGRVGYVMQDPDQMIVKDIIKDEVELGLRLRRPKKADSGLIEEQGRRALEACELYRMRNWPVSAVSYGQKKRVTVASVLAMEPELLILDEPTAGQDYRHYREIIAFINCLNGEYGKTVIFITHDMHLAIENTDRAVVFAGGKIIADGDIFSILTDERIVGEANLKKTSLHLLAEKAGLPADDFIRRYIRHEKAGSAGHTGTGAAR